MKVEALFIRLHRKRYKFVILGTQGRRLSVLRYTCLCVVRRSLAILSFEVYGSISLARYVAT